MKSDKARPTAHISMPSHKTNHPAALANGGTNEHPRKSHEADVALGEGKNYGATAIKMHTVRQAKSHMNGIQASRDNQARRENGGADPTGCCD